MKKIQVSPSTKFRTIPINFGNGLLNLKEWEIQHPEGLFLSEKEWRIAASKGFYQYISSKDVIIEDIDDPAVIDTQSKPEIKPILPVNMKPASEIKSEPVFVDQPAKPARRSKKSK